MSGLDGVIDPSAEDLAFAEPWNARAFALVIALSERGLFTLQEFQAELIEHIGAHEKTGCIDSDEVYYTRWIEAMTALLQRRSLVSGDAIVEAEARVLARVAQTREHQHAAAYRDDGSLRVEPVAIAQARA